MHWTKLLRIIFDIFDDYIAPLLEKKEEEKEWPFEERTVAKSNCGICGVSCPACLIETDDETKKGKRVQIYRGMCPVHSWQRPGDDKLNAIFIKELSD